MTIILEATIFWVTTSKMSCERKNSREYKLTRISAVCCRIISSYPVVAGNKMIWLQSSDKSPQLQIPMFIIVHSYCFYSECTAFVVMVANNVVVCTCNHFFSKSREDDTAGYFIMLGWMTMKLVM